MNKASLHKETFSSDPIKFTHFLMCTKNRIELILKNVKADDTDVSKLAKN